MSVTRVAYRYAQALLDLATEQNVVDKVNEDMAHLSDVCKGSKDFENLLNSPIINSKKKMDIFEALFGSKMDKMSLGFLNLIVKNSREVLLADIAEGFVSLYKKSKNILEVTVTSAAKLDASTKDKIVEKIKAKFEGTIELTEKVDPSLMGGFIVRMDDKQIDASISSQLANLKNVLLN